MATIIGGGESHLHSSLNLATKKGNHIRNETRLERAPDSMRAALSYSLERVSEAVRNRSLSATYNCYGLAFASRRTWVLEDAIPLILDDDGYRRLAAKSNTEVGDLVIYRDGASPSDIQHVAIVVQRKYNANNGEWSLTAMSQWGADGEYIHADDDVPGDFGDIREYWTDRKDLNERG